MVSPAGEDDQPPRVHSDVAGDPRHLSLVDDGAGPLVDVGPEASLVDIGGDNVGADIFRPVYIQLGKAD